MQSPATPELLHWEDLAEGEVFEFGAKTVSREEVLAFARDFDPQPFHLDDAAAERSLFKKLSASGWHTAAMTMRMMVDHYLSKSASLGSPGMDNIRWLKPVYPGDTLTVRKTVMQKRPMNSKPHVGLMQSRTETLNQHGEVVMSMEGWGMMRRRVPGPPAAAPAAQG